MMSNISTENNDLQEAMVIVRKKRLRKRIILISVAAAIVLIIFGMVWSFGYNCAKDNAAASIEAANRERDAAKKAYDDLLNTPIVVEPVTPEIVQKVLSSKTEEISELASAEYIFTNAARFTDTAHIIGIFDWMTKKSFVQKWDGSIKAGVQLENIQVSVKDNIITISLPYAEILSYEIDYDSAEVLDEKNNVFNPITVTDKTNFDKESKEAMIARAIENGLLEKAYNSAKNIIANMLTASVENIQDYTIEFTTPTAEDTASN